MNKRAMTMTKGAGMRIKGMVETQAAGSILHCTYTFFVFESHFYLQAVAIH
jgi:hypothetical protein